MRKRWLHIIEIEKHVENIQVPFGFARLNINDLTARRILYWMCREISNVSYGIYVFRNVAWKTGLYIFNLIYEIVLRCFSCVAQNSL